MTMLRLVAWTTVFLIGLTATSSEAQGQANNREQSSSKDKIQQIERTQNHELDKLLEHYRDFKKDNTATKDTEEDNNKNHDGTYDNNDVKMIYGGTLLSSEERILYRERMLNAKTPEEREQIQQENRINVQKRARVLGVPVPEN